jgi:hypothetical protein
LEKIVWPVIHHPSVMRNRTMVAMFADDHGHLALEFPIGHGNAPPR